MLLGSRLENRGIGTMSGPIPPNLERPMRLLLVLFVICPLLELWLLVKLGAAIGALPVVALVVLSAMLGVAVLRGAGWQAFSQAQLHLRQRLSPMPALVDGFLLTLAGILLVLPGLLSDAVALLLLIGPLRRRLARRWGKGVPVTAGVYEASADRQVERPVVIEGEYRREP
jgi:UPF0716 protein FxsA